MNIMLCGFNWIGCDILRQLLERGYNVFVYTHESPPYVNCLYSYAKKCGVFTTLENPSLREIPFKPDILVSAYYRTIISSEILRAVGGRAFNIHPSLLPKYRGCSSLTWAMVNGEQEVGVSFHYMDSVVDRGNIILQQAIPVQAFDTQVSLYHRVMVEGARMFSEAFERVCNGDLGVAQDCTKATFFRRGAPFNGEINGSWPDELIERFIRAMVFPPLEPAKFKGKFIRTWGEFLQARGSQ